jgi:hypothetical protein
LTFSFTSLWCIWFAFLGPFLCSKPSYHVCKSWFPLLASKAMGARDEVGPK